MGAFLCKTIDLALSTAVRLAVQGGLFGATALSLAAATAHASAPYREVDVGAATRLAIHHPWGNLKIEGWSRDRIRVQMNVRNGVLNPELGATLESLSVKTQGSDLLISTAFQRDSDITVRGQLRSSWEKSGFQADLEVWVPTRLSLEARTAGAGKMSLENWVGAGLIELRSGSGAISLSRARVNRLSATCFGCEVDIQSFIGSLRVFSGVPPQVQEELHLPIHLKDISGGEIFAETVTGGISAESVRGRQSYITHQGDINLSESIGEVDFATRKQGRVKLERLSGFASGKTELGSIELDAARWTFSDTAVFETEAGSVVLKLPAQLSAELDLQSGAGRTDVAFTDVAGARLSASAASTGIQEGSGSQRDESVPMRFTQALQRARRIVLEILGVLEPVSQQSVATGEMKTFGPFPPGRFVGSVGPSTRGQGVIRVRSGQGAISILRSSPE